MKRNELARLIDHTLLKPEATPVEIERLCDEALQHQFASVCVNPAYVPLAAAKLAGAKVAVCSVIGFPLGATTTTAKVCEAEQALEDGATELDMVLFIGALKAGTRDRVEEDIAAVAATCHEGGGLLKVIIEAALLSDEEKVLACELAQDAGADFVKTSTGFAASGARVEDVRLMRETVAPEIGVKAAGGIHSYQEALAMIEAGANRIGASAGVRIVEEAPA
ncbi:MAG: deoxyribose-phosphate aldolase [Chloroflexota bacterium]|nr:deoxyribose-phosphate aldolase [Chloroflexota bacterium]